MSKKSMEDRFMDAADSASEAGQTLADQRLSGSYSLTGRDGRRSLKDIKPRPGGSTRNLDPHHILDLAESIATLGLLQPIAIDTKNFLVAGEHRLEACRLLDLSNTDDRKSHWGKITSSTEKKIKNNEESEIIDRLINLDHVSFKERYSDKQVSVLVLPIDAENDFDSALAAETAENEKRQNYSKEEILNLASKLKTAGFIETKGRPKKRDKSLKKALTVISGKSYRQIQRDLTDDKSTTHVVLFNEKAELLKIANLLSKFNSNTNKGHSLNGPFKELIVKVEERLSSLKNNNDS